jgi:hypothetical protein
VITPAQCRASRALLDWSQQQLAKTAKGGGHSHDKHAYGVAPC